LVGDTLTQEQAGSSEKQSTDRLFETEHLTSDLKGRSVRGGAVTMVTQGLVFVLRIGSTAVLARLLTPKDYGLVAMVTVVTGFIALFRDLGLSTATIQKEQINHSQISTLFWINAALGICVMLVVAALAPVIARFYGEPRLTTITIGLATGFLFGGLSVQHQALLRRQMRFAAVGMAQVASVAAGIALAILAAYYGARYWALVIREVTTAVAAMICFWVMCPWRPELPRRGSGIREMLAFGGHVTGFRFINYFARNADKLLIGRLLGAGPLGLYSKAYQLLLFPIQQIRYPIASVAVPAMSRLQGTPDRYTGYYKKIVTIISFVSMPLMAYIFVMAAQIVDILLGDKWTGCVNIVRALAVAGFIQPAETTRGIIYISLGQTKRLFQVGLVSTAIIIVSFICGLPWGAIGVAIGYVVGYCLMVYPCLWHAFRFSPVTVRMFSQAVYRPAAASVVMGFATWGFCQVAEALPGYLLVLLSFGVAIVAYAIVWLAIPGGRAILSEMYSYISLLRPGAGGLAQPAK